MEMEYWRNGVAKIGVMEYWSNGVMMSSGEVL
jgi:hypothetical protein